MGCLSQKADTADPMEGGGSRPKCLDEGTLKEGVGELTLTLRARIFISIHTYISIHKYLFLLSMIYFSMFIVCMLPADPRKRTTRGSYVGMCKGCLVDRGILTLLTGGGGRQKC